MSLMWKPTQTSWGKNGGWSDEHNYWGKVETSGPQGLQEPASWTLASLPGVPLFFFRSDFTLSDRLWLGKRSPETLRCTFPRFSIIGDLRLALSSLQVKNLKKKQWLFPFVSITVASWVGRFLGNTDHSAGSTRLVWRKEYFSKEWRRIDEHEWKL